MVAQVREYRGRLLNHVEMLHQPGERQLARKLYEALGCTVTDRGSRTFSAHVAPEHPDMQNNVLYCSEVSPQQWRLEQEMRKAMGSRAGLEKAFAAYERKLTHAPHGITHFGIRYPSVERLEEVVKDFDKRLDPAVRRRTRLVRVFRPGDKDAISSATTQAFVVTDIVAAGLFYLGQLIELQGQWPGVRV
ncbi:MAG: hypothetical protein FJ039_11595 [Chloroflexi bacterium]|nr:hypothetical protein [Chloroflexota bacterium]